MLDTPKNQLSLIRACMQEKQSCQVPLEEPKVTTTVLHYYTITAQYYNCTSTLLDYYITTANNKRLSKGCQSNR